MDWTRIMLHGKILVIHIIAAKMAQIKSFLVACFQIFYLFLFGSRNKLFSNKNSVRINLSSALFFLSIILWKVTSLRGRKIEGDGVENVTIGFTILSIMLGSLILLAAILRSGKHKHDQKYNNKKSNFK